LYRDSRFQCCIRIRRDHKQGL